MKHGQTLMSRLMSTTVLVSVIAIVMVSQPAFAAKDGLVSKKQKKKWSTPWAEQVGVELVRSFDSSGPDAWDAKNTQRFLLQPRDQVMVGC